MLNEIINLIKNLIKKLFGLVDTNHDGKLSNNELINAALNAQTVTTAAKADIAATAALVKTEIKTEVNEVKQELNVVVDSAKTTAEVAKTAVNKLKKKK